MYGTVVAQTYQGTPDSYQLCNRDEGALVHGSDLESGELVTQGFNLGSGGLNKVLESFYW